MYKNIMAASLALAIAVIFLPLSASANPNDFTFTSFNANYVLGKDAENRSTLQVEELLVAEFPNYDQNHGIERAIPNVYDGHPVSLEILSVSDDTGLPRNYTTYESNNNTVLRIGDANVYVYGTQKYLIEYRMRDVTKSFTTGDEFYWDVNGAEWLQPFGTVNARLYVDESIQNAFDGRIACYTGKTGSTATDCTITNENTIIAAKTLTGLQPGENMSIVVGFAPGTFSAYVAPPTPIWLLLFIFIVIPLLYIALPIYILIWAINKWRAQGRDVEKQSTIVPQYLPPKDTSMLLADTIISTQMRSDAIAATIIHLAVTHYLKIYQIKDKEFEIEVVKAIAELHQDDKEVLTLLFGALPQIGDRVNLKNKTNLYKEVAELAKQAYEEAISNGYMVDTRKVQKKMYIIAGVVIFVGMASINPLLVVAAAALFIAAQHMPARSSNGVALKTYMDGTKMYMEVAEAERLRLLQAPDTATKVDTNDNKQLIKLYERLLPLAILYGIEKKWAQQFADLYTLETQPDWFVGNYNAFNAAAFAGALTNFGASSATSFSPPANSSGSGFSGGGGSSGGGGGGGGGGGW